MTDTTNTTNTTKETRDLERTAKIRKMLAQGLEAKVIAAALACDPQIVYGVKYYDRKKKAAARAKAKAKAVATPPTTAGLQAQIEAMREANKWLSAEVKILRESPPITVEVPVPQPFSHYTFWQRLRILFTGSAA